MLQNATFLRKSAPWPPNISDGDDWLTFDKVQNPWRLRHKATLERAKVVRTWCVSFLPLKMRVAPSQCELFNISTSKSGPRISVSCTLWLRSVLCATTACPFVNNWTSKSAPRLTLVCFYHFDVLACFARTLSTSQFPKVLRTRSGFNVVTSKCALRHSAVQFLISHLPRWLCTRRFREPTFRPSGILQHWKNTAFRDFSTFSCALIFFVLTLSLSPFFLSSHLCCCICPYCRKFD